MRKSSIGLSAVLWAVVCCGSSDAGFVTSSAGFASPKVVDFSQFNGPFQHTVGPIEVGSLVGEVTIWSATFDDSVIGNKLYGIANNGFWNSSRNGYVGSSDRSDGYMRFDFLSGRVAKVGAFINYATDPGDMQTVWIEALDSNDNVLETHNITLLAPINTPDALNEGAFRGISRATRDIAAIRFRGAFVVLDDLTFTRDTTSVPEPSTYLLGAFALLGLYAFRRRIR